MSLSVGLPYDGWQLRPRRVREGAHLEIRPGSRNANYGHPSLVYMLERSADDVAAALPGAKLLLGDLSAAQGGPLAGHRSHQNGRDADVALFTLDSRGRSVSLEHFVAFDLRGHGRSRADLRFDVPRNWLLLRAWLLDRRAMVSHVFVARHLKALLMAEARERGEPDELILRAANMTSQPEGLSDHADHFHVRIACPVGQEALCQLGGD